MGKRKSESGDTDTSVNTSVNDVDGDTEEKVSWEEKIRFLSPLSSPLASKKLTKKIYKTIKKAAKTKSCMKGVKNVQKGLRKGQKGILILAGDVSPIDVISHIPIMCEDLGLQYCYIPSKKDLGVSTGSKRASSLVLIQQHESLQDEYSELLAKIKELPKDYS